MPRTTEKAITLISLVVTIVILLILAGITIAAVTGDSGIINQTRDAKDALEIEEIRENIGLAYLKAEAGNRRRNTDLSAKIKSELDKTYGTENVTVTQGADGKTYDVIVKGKKFFIDRNGNIALKSGLTLSEHTLIINPNSSLSDPTLTATLDEDVTGDITWESSNTSIVTVTGNGTTATVSRVENVISGTATITAKIDGTEHYDKCTVTVEEAYTITYLANTGTDTMEAGTKKSGENYTIASNGFTAPSGKVFKEWNTSADGTGTSYSEGATYSTDADLTLYAQWSISEIAEGVTTRVTYGKYVNYNIDLGIGTANDVTDDWKVFYDDGTNIYIIAADYVPNTNTTLQTAVSNMGATANSTYCVYWPSAGFKTSQGGNTFSAANGAADIFSASRPTGTAYLEGKGFLEYWKGQTTTSSNPNAQMTASLMDTKVWEGFAGGVSGAYAIGGPTLSMWVESWNANTQTAKATKLYYNNATTTGYKVGTSSTPTSDYVDLSSNSDYTGITSSGTAFTDDLYFPHKGSSPYSDCYGYWLASPSAGEGDVEMFVSYDGGVSVDYYGSGYYGVRPVVCLPSTVSLNWDSTNNVYNIN